MKCSLYCEVLQNTNIMKNSRVITIKIFLCISVGNYKNTASAARVVLETLVSLNVGICNICNEMENWLPGNVPILLCFIRSYNFSV